MKTIYSILYLTINTALNERVSIGLLMSDGKNSIFKYSSDKLLVIKGLINSERYHFAKAYLRSLDSDINGKEPSLLFEKDALKNSWVTERYISYLAKYSNNSIQFSEPKQIDVDFSRDNFKIIFEKYVAVYEPEADSPERENIYLRVKSELYPRIDPYVNLDISLDSTHFENLFAPIEVNFIGINSVPVAGQAFDFEKKHYFLENDVTRFVSLTKAIELEDKRKGHYFVLGREPGNNGGKNHLLWEQIRDSDFLDFVDIDEMERVGEYIEYNHTRPYFKG